MDNVIVLVKDHIRLQARQLALETQQIIGQRQDRDAVAKAAQHACEVTDKDV